MILVFIILGIIIFISLTMFLIRLFNVKLEIVGETTSNAGGDLFDSYFIVEDLENSVRNDSNF